MDRAEFERRFKLRIAQKLEGRDVDIEAITRDEFDAWEQWALEIEWAGSPEDAADEVMGDWGEADEP